MKPCARIYFAVHHVTFLRATQPTFCTNESLISLRIAEHFGGKFFEHFAGPLEKQQRERRIKGGVFVVKLADAFVSLSGGWRYSPADKRASASTSCTSTASRRIFTMPSVCHWQRSRLTVNSVVPVNCASSARDNVISRSPVLERAI